MPLEKGGSVTATRTAATDARQIYCAEGASCNGAECGCPGLSTAGDCRNCGARSCGLRGRPGVSAEAVVSFGCWLAALSGVMMLTGGMEEEDGKNSLPPGLTAPSALPAGELNPATPAPGRLL